MCTVQMMLNFRLPQRTKKWKWIVPDTEEIITSAQSLTLHTIKHSLFEWPCFTEHNLICPRTINMIQDRCSSWHGWRNTLSTIHHPASPTNVVQCQWAGLFFPVWATVINLCRYRCDSWHGKGDPAESHHAFPQSSKTHLSISHSPNQAKKKKYLVHEDLRRVISATLPCKWSQFWWSFFQGCCRVQGPTPPLHPRSKGGAQVTNCLPGGSWSTYGSVRWSGIRIWIHGYKKW